ncbi:MAG: hypothetical protein HDT42_09940 [Ruminococcaceae bacterium]|nr:hypothetical protein [Oscillospiraceae bacterium]
MKDLLALLIITTVLLCAGCSQNRNEFSDRRSDEVIAASADLYQKFDSGNRIVYPDYYAGRYFSEDGKKLFINVTSAYNSELDFLLEKYDCVEFSEVKYSKNELYSLSDQYKTELAYSFPELEFFQPKLDEKDNCVFIELELQTLENEDIMGKLKNHFNGKSVTFGEPSTNYLLD